VGETAPAFSFLPKTLGFGDRASAVNKFQSLPLAAFLIERRTPVNSYEVVEIDFEELSDGSLVELIEDPVEPTKTLLAVYSNKSVRYTDKVDDRGRRLVALARAANDLKHVCLAAGVQPCGGIHDLVSNIVSILSDCLDLELGWQKLMSAFAISTWFPERLDIAPYLALVGPPGTGKTTAMRVLNSICYRGLLTADISSSAMYDISHRIHPTVSLDETLTAGRPRELIHLLKATSTPGFVFLRKDKARLAFGPKIFSWLELPDDQALNSRCIIIPMHKTSRTDLKSPNDPKVLECAKQMRMRLLQFRFERFRNASESNPCFDNRLSGRPLDLYRALTLSIKDHEPFCEFLADKIAAQGELQPRPLSPAQVSTLWVLYQIIHACPNDSFCTMSELAACVNFNLAERGEPSRLNERKLGGILTSLSLTNRTRTNQGYVVWLERAERLWIHEAARAYGIERSLLSFIKQSTNDKCSICTLTTRPVLAGPPPPKPAPVKAQMRAIETAAREGRERRVRRSRRLRFRAGLGSD
jgi:hypothetical protein